MSNKEQFEREFESFLNEENSRIAALYRKLPRPEPDAKLDAAVLAMARRGAAAAPHIRARVPRWIPALSAAAVVALAAGIAFRIGPQVWQERSGPPAQKPALEKGSAPAPAAADMKKVQHQETDALKDKAAAESAQVPEPVREPAPEPATEPATAAASAVRPSAGAPAAGHAAPAKPEVRMQARKMEYATKRVDAPAPQPFPVQSAVEQEKKPVESGMAAGDNNAVQGAARDDLDAQGLDRKRDEPAPPATAAPASAMHEERAPAPMSAPAATPPLPPSREQPATTSAQLPGDAMDESALAAPAAKAARMAPLRSKDPNARLYPEHWIENIRTMLRENKRDEALHSLAEFRRMYPQYHLPDDLRDLK